MTHPENINNPSLRNVIPKGWVFILIYNFFAIVLSSSAMPVISSILAVISLVVA
jgi:hypothetical protein